jgi:hypothetical protein
MNLPHVCKIERSVFSKDEEGAATPGPETAIHSALPCFVQADNATEAIQFHRLEGIVPYKVYTSTDPTVKPQDKLTPLNGTFANKTFNVLGQRDMAGLGRWFRIDCEDIPSGQHVQ